MRFLGLIPKYLLKNRKRTILIAIGIMLSSFLLTTMNVAIKNYKEKAYKTAIEMAGGDFHGYNVGIPMQYIGWVKTEKRVTEAGRSINLGYMNTEDKENTLKISSYTEEARNMLLIEVKEGKYPTDNNEVAMEAWILNKFFPSAKIGDKVKISFDRIYYEITGGKLQKKDTIECTLTGILKDRYNSQINKTGFACVTEEFVESLLPKELYVYDTYVKTTLTPTRKDMSNLASVNTTMLIPNPYLDKYYSDSKKTEGIIIGLTIVILIAAVALIYNIYSIIVVERYKEFGLLRVVGAEPSQIKILVFGEAFILATLFIPLGMVLGIEGAKILNRLTNNGISNGVIAVPKATLIYIFIICFITVVASAIKPALSAANISALNAINYTGSESISKRNKNKHVDQLNPKFKFTTNMSLLNIKRNKKRFIVTIVSLSMSIMIFIVSIGIIKWLDPNNLLQGIGSDYILKVESERDYSGFEEEIVEEIANLDGVKKAEPYKYAFITLIASGDLMSKEYLEENKSRVTSGNILEHLAAKNLYMLGAEIYGLKDEQLKKLSKYIEDKNINIDDLKKSGEILAFINYNYKKDFKVVPAQEYTFIFGCRDDAGNYINENINLTIKGTVSELDLPMLDNKTPIALIAHEDTLKKVAGFTGYQAIRVDSNNKDNPSLEAKLKQYVSKHRDGKFISYIEQEKLFKALSRDTKIVLYSFVVIVMFIGIISIINTVTMNILLRKKEAATLRAIGMSNREYKLILVKEAVIYGLVSGTTGVVLGLIIYSMGLRIFRKAAYLKWSIDLWVIRVVYILSIFICILASLPPLKRIMTSSVVEDIRSVD